MLKRKIRTLAVSGITIVAATVLTALFATGASATVTATANPGHADVAATTVVSATPAAANASATPNSDATPYYVCNITLGCIGEPGHGNLVYVRFARNITLNLVYQETVVDAYYWLRFNGTNECLNYSPATGFVYEDSCQPDDPNEMWEHHNGNLLGNLATGTRLYTCNNSGNARLSASPTTPPGCNVPPTRGTSPNQWNWLFIQA